MLNAAAIVALGTLAVTTAQLWSPRTGYRAEAMAVETAGQQPTFEFTFPKTDGKLLIERVAIRVVEAPISGYCGFGDPAANRVESSQVQVPLNGVPQRTTKTEWHSDTIDSVQAIVVDAGSAYKIRVAGRCGAASAKATVIGSWVQ